MSMLRLLLFLCVYGFSTVMNAQSSQLDSLQSKLRQGLDDSTRCVIIGKIIELESDENWSVFNAKLFEITNKNTAGKKVSDAKFFNKMKASALHNMGYEAKRGGEVMKALEYYNQALEIKKQLNNKEDIASTLMAIGICYDDMGNIDKGLELYHEALKIYRALKNNEGIADALNNLAYVYNLQGDEERSKAAHFEALEIYRKLGNYEGMAGSYHNLGLYYAGIKDVKNAILYYEKALEAARLGKYEQSIPFSLCNMAMLYAKYGDPQCEKEEEQCKKEGYEKALIYTSEAINIAVTSDNAEALSFAYDNMANIKLRQGKYDEAKEYGLKCMEQAKKLAFPENIRAAATVLKRIYEKQNKYKDALEMYELSVQMSDSIDNERTRKASVRKQLQIEYELQSAKDSIASEAKIREEKLKNEQEVTRQKTFTYSGIAGLLVMIVVAALAFRAYTTKKKANVIISAQKQLAEEQKHIIEEKHKEITDSINYAERIQRSFLASEELLHENLMEYFIMFRPKDVVSGDFYWAAKLNNGNFAFVTADSTGHGVPGAIMSLLNITSLEKAIESISDPAEILNHTRKTIIARLKKDGSAEGGKDGMDCSFISLDKRSRMLYVAAANNPVWIARNKELIEIKGDKMPVGKHDKDQLPFTLHSFQLEPGDMIYALTDGFPDQFGGPNGKKFMSKNLKELLVSNSDLPLSEQKEKLVHALKNWMGAQEQIDDVTVVGIRI